MDANLRGVMLALVQNYGREAVPATATLLARRPVLNNWLSELNNDKIRNGTESNQALQLRDKITSYLANVLEPKVAGVTYENLSAVLAPVLESPSVNIKPAPVTVGTLLNQQLAPNADIVNAYPDLLVGKYSLTLDLSLEGIGLEYLQSQLLGNSAEKILTDSCAAQKVMTLPIAGKQVRFIAFQKTELVPIISKRWILTFELLENPVPPARIISGIAVVAGVLAIYLTFRSIEKISDNVGS